MRTIVCLRGISFATFLVTFVLFLVSFSAAYWRHAELLGHGGLWVACSYLKAIEGCTRIEPSNASAMLKSVQAMMCLAMICLVASLAAFITWMTKSSTFVADRGKDSTADIALMSWAVGGGFNTLGIMIHGFDYVNDGDKLGWTFGLAAFTGVFSLAASAGFTCSMWSYGKSRSSTQRSGAAAVNLAYPQPQMMTQPVYVIQQNNRQQQPGQANYQSMAVAYQPAAPSVYQTNMAAYGQAQATLPQAQQQSDFETKTGAVSPQGNVTSNSEERQQQPDTNSGYRY